MPAAHATIADALDAVMPAFDQLVADSREGCRFGRPDQWLETREQQAQAVCAAILAPFRGRGARPVNPPRFVSADGTKAAW